MVLSLIFIVGFFSLLLLPITCLTLVFSQHQQQQQQQPHVSHSSVAEKRHVSSIWSLLLNNTIFPTSHVTGSKEKGGRKYDGEVRRFAGKREAAEECRVCLCEVEEGEEVSDLRCNHLFHKVCLDAWVGSGHAMCPLCRGRVFSPAVEELPGSTSELLFFHFSSRQARREGNWWIR